MFSSFRCLFVHDTFWPEPVSVTKSQHHTWVYILLSVYYGVFDLCLLLWMILRCSVVVHPQGGAAALFNVSAADWLKGKFTQITLKTNSCILHSPCRATQIVWVLCFIFQFGYLKVIRKNRQLLHPPQSFCCSGLCGLTGCFSTDWSWDKEMCFSPCHASL